MAIRRTTTVPTTHCIWSPPLIGNQADISIRALAVLSKVDAIACEETRHSKTFAEPIRHSKPLIAAHEHNENAAAQQIIERLQRGERIALITDAGTPAISETGARGGARTCCGLARGADSGASAVVTALSATGVEHGFSFVGFYRPNRRRGAYTGSMATAPRIAWCSTKRHTVAPTPSRRWHMSFRRAYSPSRGS